jgi:DNA-binding transcriptional MerR regulator
MTLPNTENLTKLYYSIGEVAALFDVSPSLIRYWESEFNYLKPHKSGKGERRYTKQNIEQFKQIYHLVKEKGYTLDGAKKELKENKQRVNNLHNLEQTLNGLKKKLESLRDRLNN